MAGAGRPDAARRRERPPGLAVVERAGVAELLARPKRGVQYLVAVQTPQYADRLDRRAATPRRSRPARRQRRSSSRNLAQISRTSGPANVTHYNVARTFDVQANVDGTDLGSVGDAASTAVVDELQPQLPRGTTMQRQGPGREHGIVVPRPGATASSSRSLLVYLLMVVNFQSWLDPFIILMALPGRARGHRVDAVRRRARRSACRR